MSTKLPTPDDLTEADRDAIASIARQADAIAERILAAEVPHVADHLALRGLIALGNGSGLFAPTPTHVAALNCPPPAAELAEWERRKEALSLMRHGSPGTVLA